MLYLSRGNLSLISLLIVNWIHFVLQVQEHLRLRALGSDVRRRRYRFWPVNIIISRRHSRLLKRELTLIDPAMRPLESQHRIDHRAAP